MEVGTSGNAESSGNPESSGGEADSGTSGNVTLAETTGDATGETTGGTSDEPVFDPPEETWRATSTSGSLHVLCVQPNDDIVIGGSRATFTDPGEGFVQTVSSDGAMGWRTGFGSIGNATFIHGLACGADGSIYAVGATAESGSLNTAPLVAKLDPETGDKEWEVTFEGTFQTGELMGAFADDSGVYVVGRWSESVGNDPYVAYLAHYRPDGTEDWVYRGTEADLYDALVHDGTLLVSGSLEQGFDRIGVVAAFSLSGQPLWDHAFNHSDSYGYFLAPDPETGGVLAAGYLDQNSDEFEYVLRCTADACDAEPLELGGTRDFDGFAVDGRGHWLHTSGARIYARIPGGGEAWSYDADLFRQFVGIPSADLAVDSTGAIILGGHTDPPTVIKFAPS